MKKLIVFIFTALAMLNAAAGRDKTEKAEATLRGGETLALSENYVRTDTELEAELKFDGFQPFRLGRAPQGKDGKWIYRGGWVEVTEKEVIIYDIVLVSKEMEEDSFVADKKKAKTIRARVPKEVDRFEHGLNLRNAKKLEVKIEAGHGDAELEIECGKQEFKRKIEWWAGGMPYVMNLGEKDAAVKLEFERKNADTDFWFYSASNFNSTNSARWPYYMLHEGHTKWMADHIPGGKTKMMIQCFKNDLAFGTPKFALWFIGSNDPADTEEGVNPEWLKNTEEFLSICKAKGITPILVTNHTPNRKHGLKNRWVRESGYRYCDLELAVVGHISEGVTVDGWANPEWVGKDGIHPTKEGAKVLWEQVKKDIPELSAID